MTMKQLTASPLSLFTALDQFDTDDKQAEKRRKLNEASSLSKSKAVQSQTNIYAGLVEIRILLQRIISSSEDPKNVDSGELDVLNDLLSKLLHARKKIPTSSEITTTVTSSDDDNDYNQLVKKDSKQIQDTLQNEHENLSNEWKTVLNTRYHTLRVNLGLSTTKKSNKKFQAVDISFWDQIQQTLQHDQLLKNKDVAESEDVASLLDDSKIYKYMLQEYLSGTTSSSMPKTQQKRKGNKNKVDRKASKGRKIRYVPHTKLENFAFPINRMEPIISEDEWFQSLFGGRK